MRCTDDHFGHGSYVQECELCKGKCAIQSEYKGLGVQAEGMMDGERQLFTRKVSVQGLYG